jgi:hypothetical protein
MLRAGKKKGSSAGYRSGKKEPVRVLKSRLPNMPEGRNMGLFAAKNLPEGYAIRFKGSWTSESLVPVNSEERDYAITSQGVVGKLFIGDPPRCKASRANDGQLGPEKMENNCELMERWTRGSRKQPRQFSYFALRTLREIKKGEELLVSYGPDHCLEEPSGGEEEKSEGEGDSTE